MSLADVEAAVCEFRDDRPQVVSLQPNSLADVWDDFRRVGEALGVLERGSIDRELSCPPFRKPRECLPWDSLCFRR